MSSPHRRFIQAVLALGLLAAPLRFGLPQASAATTAIAFATDDAPVAESTPTTPAPTAALATSSDSWHRAASYLKFTVSGLPAGATGIHATLKVRARSSAITTVQAHTAKSANWNQATLTWRNQPWWNTSLLSSVGSITAWTTVTFDVSGAVTGNGVVALVLTAKSGGLVQYNSKEAAYARPELDLSWSAPTTTTVKPTTTTVKPTTTTAPACKLSAILVPCAGAWWGMQRDVGAGQTELTTLTGVEAQAGRKFDIAHAFHRWGEAFPTADEVAWADGGRFLLINYKPLVSWASVANGSGDLVLNAECDRLKAFGRKLFLTFHHEPEDNVPGYGTPADYVAAYRHVHDTCVARGATNIVWVWTMMGFSGWASMYPSLYPGDAWVDWIAWDPYNKGGSWASFDQVTSYFYGWATTNHPGKPLMLAEYGSQENPSDATGPTSKAQWFRDELTALKGDRKSIRAVVYWDNVGVKDYRLETSTASMSSFAAVGNDPFVNQPHS